MGWKVQREYPQNDPCGGWTSGFHEIDELKIPLAPFLVLKSENSSEDMERQESKGRPENCIKTLRNSKENDGLVEETAGRCKGRRREKTKVDVSQWNLRPVQGGSCDLGWPGSDKS